MEILELADALGPARLMHVWEPRLGMKAVVAIDNVACGPAIGGIRMAPDVTVEEACRLDRAMTCYCSGV
jgi:glutamate dehydrogenase (NAD(P)+)